MAAFPESGPKFDSSALRGMRHNGRAGRAGGVASRGLCVARGRDPMARGAGLPAQARR